MGNKNKTDEQIKLSQTTARYILDVLSPVVESKKMKIDHDREESDEFKSMMVFMIQLIVRGEMNWTQARNLTILLLEDKQYSPSELTRRCLDINRPFGEIVFDITLTQLRTAYEEQKDK